MSETSEPQARADTRTFRTPKIKVEHHDIANVDAEHSEVLANKDIMHDAYDGENTERSMDGWKATKAPPWPVCGLLSCASSL